LTKANGTHTVFITLYDVNGKAKMYKINITFGSPAGISSVDNFDNLDFTMIKECSDEILTGNITDIDREALVNITYS